MTSQVALLAVRCTISFGFERPWPSILDDPEDVWRRRPQGHRELSEVFGLRYLAGRNLGMAGQGLSKTRGYEQSTGSGTTRLVIESGISLRPDDRRELGEIR